MLEDELEKDTEAEYNFSLEWRQTEAEACRWLTLFSHNDTGSDRSQQYEMEQAPFKQYYEHITVVA